LHLSYEFKVQALMPSSYISLSVAQKLLN
jgi:hypothetical protein